MESPCPSHASMVSPMALPPTVCEDDVGDVAMVTEAQLLRVLEVSAGQTHHERLGVVERGCLVLVRQAFGADGRLEHVELLQLL